MSGHIEHNSRVTPSPASAEREKATPAQTTPRAGVAAYRGAIWQELYESARLTRNRVEAERFADDTLRRMAEAGERSSQGRLVPVLLSVRQIAFLQNLLSPPNSIEACAVLRLLDSALPPG